MSRLLKKIFLSLMFLSIGQMCANSERAFIALAGIGCACIGHSYMLTAQNDKYYDEEVYKSGASHSDINSSEKAAPTVAKTDFDHLVTGAFGAFFTGFSLYSLYAALFNQQSLLPFSCALGCFGLYSVEPHIKPIKRVGAAVLGLPVGLLGWAGIKGIGYGMKAAYSWARG